MTDNTIKDTVLTKLMWNTQVFAPTHYPIELVTGESFWFFDEMGDDRVGFYAKAGGGWRNGATDTIGGSPSHPVSLPLGVKLMWLSLVEHKFYHTVMLLPQDTLVQLAQQTLTTDEQVVKNLINIQFAIAPNGFVSLRAGFASHIQELDTHTAEVANASWEFFALTNHFDPNLMSMEQYIAKQLDKVPPTFLEEAKQGNLPKRWENYSTHKFPWHVASDVTLVAYQIGFVNGEITTTHQPTHPTSSQTPTPVPAWLSLFFKQQGRRQQALVYLSKHTHGKTEQPEDDLAVFEAFVKFFGSSHQIAALVVNLQKDNEVFLTNGYHTQPLMARTQIRTLETNEHPWFE